MATKKAMQKKMASRKPQQGAGIAPQVSDEYQVPQEQISRADGTFTRERNLYPPLRKVWHTRLVEDNPLNNWPASCPHAAKNGI
jgi:hypothetical protein